MSFKYHFGFLLKLRKILLKLIAFISKFNIKCRKCNRPCFFMIVALFKILILHSLKYNNLVRLVCHVKRWQPYWRIRAGRTAGKRTCRPTAERQGTNVFTILLWKKQSYVKQTFLIRLKTTDPSSDLCLKVPKVTSRKMHENRKIT